MSQPLHLEDHRLRLFLAQAMCELTGSRADVALETVEDVATGGTRITMVVTFPPQESDDGDVAFEGNK